VTDTLRRAPLALREFGFMRPALGSELLGLRLGLGILPRMAWPAC
jgi:hypothetical protein